VLIAAERLGIAGLLEQQLQQSQADRYKWVLSQFPDLAPKGPKMFQGAADIYRFVAGTSLGKETPENRDKGREGKDVVRSLAQERG